MKWKDFIADYLHFTRRERVAILVLITLIIVVLLAPDFFSPGLPETYTARDTSWIAALEKLEQKDPESDNDPSYQESNSSYSHFDRTRGTYSKKKAELFYFDPNTLSMEGWEKLGIRDKTIHTIQHYLGKGGRFRKAEDVKRIYGLFPDEYERIAPYIRIATDSKTGEQLAERSYTNAENKPVRSYAPKYSIVDINTADTAAFISLPGIGSKLSARIVSFRDKLGGFYSINQVAETFGLHDSTFQKIKPYLKLENASVRKININTATIDELKAHPYIKYRLANPIVAYRNEHGPFTKAEEIKKVMAITDEIYKRFSPYLTL